MKVRLWRWAESVLLGGRTLAGGGDVAVAPAGVARRAASFLYLVLRETPFGRLSVPGFCARLTSISRNRGMFSFLAPRYPLYGCPQLSRFDGVKLI